MRRFELPVGTKADEVADFIALQLEELSPFPLDQLHHGYLRASDGSAVFAYAAYRRRLPAGQADAWSSAQFVLPDFAPVLRLRFPAATVVLFRSPAALTALYFETDREMPVRAAGRALAADASPEVEAATRRAVLKLVEAGPTRELVLEAGALPQQRAQGLTFVLPAEGRTQPYDITLPVADCWTMDVREPEFVAEQRQRLRIDLVFWRIVQGSVAALLLLTLGELLMLAGSGYTAWLKKRLDDRQPAAQAIIDKKALTVGLDDFRQRAVHPFDMFRVLGRGRMPSVYFTSTRLEGLKMTIEGEAPNLAEFNAYIANLKMAPELAGPPAEDDVKVRDNVTTFKIVVNFKPGVFAIAQQPATP